ncbi:MAG TPA: pirin family protein [bacterium]|jgi:redox-sensitive bicupin YhaK (pirin superfamily)
MPQFRPISRIIEPQWVLEGAGVKLRRSIATRTLNYVDPFLLFDHFGSDEPEDYLAGFPLHPHRGIETVTYMLAGSVNHKDSIGNAGSIGAGDVQWMTSGRGIMHEEMPKPVNGRMEGFQLWVNLPAKLKMTAPRYQEILSAKIPQFETPEGAKIRVIAGKVNGISGAVTEIYADPTYLDVTIPPDKSFSQLIAPGHAAFAYVFEGEGNFFIDDKGVGETIPSPRLVVFDDGDAIRFRAGQKGARFLLISGLPLNEPIARYGPFVMNTQAEIQQALDDLRNGTFVK